MANPKPLHTLTAWRVLAVEEASEVMSQGCLGLKMKVAPTSHLTEDDMTNLKDGIPIFAIWKGYYVMVAFSQTANDVVCFEIYSRPPKELSFLEKVKNFFIHKAT